MSLISYLTYLAHRLKTPNRADFLSEGFGIYARWKRCRHFWAKHLQFSKEFQALHLGNLGQSMAVLGAGRLLDVDGASLEKFSRVELYDADPGAVSSWRRLQKRIGDKLSWHVIDLTGKIDNWSSRLRLDADARSSNDVVHFLKGLAAEPIEPFPLVSFDTIVSLNLLSQIPIYWRERALETLGALGEDRCVAAALDQTLATLQRHHLHSLEASSARTVITISDEEFLYYKRTHAQWQSEPALFFKEPVALKGYTLAAQDSWFWHIAPQGIEFPDYGVIHRVVARAFTLNSPAK